MEKRLVGINEHENGRDVKRNNKSHPNIQTTTERPPKTKSYMIKKLYGQSRKEGKINTQHKADRSSAGFIWYNDKT